MEMKKQNQNKQNMRLKSYQQNLIKMGGKK